MLLYWHRSAPMLPLPIRHCLHDFLALPESPVLPEKASAEVISGHEPMLCIFLETVGMLEHFDQTVPIIKMPLHHGVDDALISI